MIVEISGIDGCGKTTVLEELKGRLIKKGYSTSIRSPKSKSWLLMYTISEQSALEFFDLFGNEATNIAALLDLYFDSGVIFGAQSSKTHIFLIDRYKLSHITEAIISSVKNMKGIEELLRIIPSPNLSIQLQTSPQHAMERINNRASNDSRVFSHGISRLIEMHRALNFAAEIVDYDVEFISNDRGCRIEDIVDSIEAMIIDRY